MLESVIDILSQETSYLHFSLPDSHTLIYDVSGCEFVAIIPNPDHTLTALKHGEQVQLEPIKPKP